MAKRRSVEEKLHQAKNSGDLASWVLADGEKGSDKTARGVLANEQDDFDGVVVRLEDVMWEDPDVKQCDLVRLLGIKVSGIANHMKVFPEDYKEKDRAWLKGLRLLKHDTSDHDSLGYTLRIPAHGLVV